jgi:hypothetical protein
MQPDSDPKDQAHRAFFLFGFAQSRQTATIDEETAIFKKAARHVHDSDT